MSWKICMLLVTAFFTVNLHGTEVQAAEPAVSEPGAPPGANPPPLLQHGIEKLFHLESPEAPKDALFWGRFHVALVHLPIGLLIGLFVMELWAAMSGAEDYQRATTFIAGLAALAAIAATITGVLLSLRGQYDPNLLFRHTWLGFATMVLAIMVWFGRGLYSRTGELGVGTVYYLTLLAVMVVLGFGTYDGIQMTHGPGYLTQYTPQSIRDIFAPREQAGAAEGGEATPSGAPPTQPAADAK